MVLIAKQLKNLNISGGAQSRRYHFYSVKTLYVIENPALSN